MPNQTIQTIRPSGVRPPPLKASRRAPSYGDILSRTAPQRTAGGYSDYLGLGGQVNLDAISRNVGRLHDDANAANEFRYAQASDLLSASLGESLGYLDKYGTDAKERIKRTANDDLANYDSDAISRGIFNTSFSGIDKRRIKEDRDRQMAAIDERANMLRADTSRAGYGDLVNLISSRQDEGPNVDSYLNLIQQQARLRAEESARNADKVNQEAERRRNESMQPTAIVNGVPQYGNPGYMPPLGGGGMSNGLMQPQQNFTQPRRYVGVSATSMGGGPALAPLQAGTAPWSGYYNYPQQPQQQPAQQQQPAKPGYNDAMRARGDRMRQLNRYNQTLRALPPIPPGLNPFSRR